MRWLRLIVTVVLIGLVCAERQAEIAGANNKVVAAAEPPTTASRMARTTGSSQVADVPAQFKSFDFGHLKYPTHYFGTIPLKEGAWEKKGVIGGTTIDLTDVHYVDVNGNGHPLAIVRLTQVICGGSCDGSSALFYFFSSAHNKPTLLSHIETGSVAYTCGLKSFVLNGRTLTLEAFRKCSFSNGFLKSAYDADLVGGKFIAKEFTRFVLHFNGQRFVVMKRSLLSNPDADIRNYRINISITNYGRTTSH